MGAFLRSLDPWGKRLREQRVASLPDQSELKRILQLSDVAGPVVLHEEAHGFGKELHGLPLRFGGKFLEDGTDQQRDVFLAVPEGRDHDGDHIQAIKEILPEPSLVNGLPKRRLAWCREWPGAWRPSWSRLPI